MDYGESRMFSIRYVRKEDRAFWFTLDRHLPPEEFDRKVRDRMGYVLLRNGEPVGLLRYNLFWDHIPFCNMLYIEQRVRGQGGGKELMLHWERDMKDEGYGVLMTSTQSDEDAQHFYRKLGYQDAGGLLLPVPGYEQPMEIFFIKKI